uniref:hypothetical protein n=1 Tax=Anaerospora sp. TaxID=1960278 RepID=UPI0028A1810E
LRLALQKNLHCLILIHNFAKTLVFVVHIRRYKYIRRSDLIYPVKKERALNVALSPFKAVATAHGSFAATVKPLLGLLEYGEQQTVRLT